MSEYTNAAMPWAFLMIVLIFGVGVLVFLALDPVVDLLAEYVGDYTKAGGHGEKGLATVTTVWDYWPVWFLGALMAFGFVESVRNSQRGGFR